MLQPMVSRSKQLSLPLPPMASRGKQLSLRPPPMVSRGEQLPLPPPVNSYCRLWSTGIAAADLEKFGARQCWRLWKS
jgi:hypothetical protein